MLVTNFTRLAHVGCVHVLFCVVLFFPDCLRVTTGTSKYSVGNLQVIVNGVNVTGQDVKYYGKGEVVVDKCFQSLDKIQIRNPTTDAWAGSILALTGDSDSYKPFSRCVNCVKGDASAADAIVVDGDDDSVEYGKTSCINGATCDLHFLPGWHRI